MHSFRPVWLARHAFILTAVIVLTVGAANAQFARSADSSNEVAVSPTESSSASDPMLAVDGNGLAALPAAPAAAGGSGAAGRQNGGYDTQNRGSFFSRMTWEGGGGFNAPAGDDITWGANFTVGGGLHFNPRWSALIEYQFIHDKLPGRLIGDVGATGGYANIWSFTIAPVFDLFPKKSNDIYVTGGGGFYRKVTSFTDPEPALFCSYFYCGIGYQNTVVGHFSSNQGGWNIGAGYQHRLGGMYGDSRMKLFAEARYLRVLSPATTTAPNGLGVTSVQENTNLIPVTFGVRW
jgi:Outer membrane protein beta-barrel domain